MRISSKILQRDKVNTELQNILNFPLTIVTAPMGYGKTTAVKSYLLTNKIRHIWITLNEASKNTGYFWFVLTNKISAIDSDLGRVLYGLGFPQDNIQMEILIETRISHFMDKDIVLVFDDYQFAETDKLNNLLVSITKLEIPNLHIVVISRHLLKIDLTELVVKKLIYQIDDKILRFSNSDVKLYFDGFSMPIQKNKISSIQNIAGGWVAALYLIYMGLKEGIPLENITEIQALIKCALYEPYDDDTKKALCTLSLLDNFTIDLALYITGIESINNIIYKLYKENSFISLDVKTKTYTIHNVYRNFLVNESVKMNLDTKEINRNAGFWHIEQGDITHAFIYFYKAEDYQLILTELEKPSLYIKSSDRNMLFNFFEKIPSSENEKHPIAYLKLLMLQVISGDKKRGCTLLTQFENNLKLDIFNDEMKKEVVAAIHLIKVFLSFNNIELMINHTEEALNLLDGGVSVISSYQVLFSFGSPHLSYIYYKEIGTYKKISEMPYEKYAKVSGGAGLGSEALCKAEYSLETGDFDSVELYAFKAIYQAREKAQTSMVVCATFTLARLYICLNRYSDAIALLNELHEEVISNVESILMNTYDLCLGYIYVCTGEYEKIPKWIRDGDMTINSLMMQGAVFSYVVYGKVLILLKNWAKAEALCETFNSYFSIFNNQLGFLHNNIHLAIAAFNRGCEEKAKAYLNKALIIGQADNIIMPFIENGNKLIPLLKKFKAEDGIDIKFINAITGSCANYSKVPSNKSFLNIPLSSRETEVLKLISKGMSRNEIAEEMFISPGTVRTHIQNIYKKLEVNNKIDAINKASKNNIL